MSMFIPYPLGAVSWRPFQPGNSSLSFESVPRTATQAGSRTAILGNKAIVVQLANVDKDIQFAGLVDKYTGETLAMGSSPFTITLGDGRVLTSATMAAAGCKEIKEPSQPKALRKESKKAGAGLEATFTDPSTGLTAHWTIILRNGDDFAQENLTLSAPTGTVDVKTVDFGGFQADGAHVVGSVTGSPVTAGNMYFGLEHPMAESSAPDGVVHSEMVRKLPITQGTTVDYDFVMGVVPPGQMRRGFQNMVEDIRARPYSPFLHYNSWYDLGYFTPYTADQCVDRINAFGEELSVKRHVKLSSFLFDDGWDDHHSLWKFNSGFPDGFTPLKEAAAKYGAGPGVWLSPWGGYGDPRSQRLAYGKTQGMEIDSEGYALSGPKYYKVFHDVTMNFVKNEGINQFKFDGTGSPDKKYPGSAFDSDFAAAIALIGDLRQARPDLFVNLTTGTWPSPFWLRYADSTWRGGYDHNFAGVGPWREKWITYRDGDTYHGVVEKGPLYPINSLMLHGIIYAKFADHLGDDPSNDFRNEVRDYFSTGTQLQEMYITPQLLTKANWDDLAESAKWSAANANTLRDVHWVGGDPDKLEVYGWASWSSKKAILSLRNPSDQPQAYSIDLGKLLESPQGSAVKYKVHLAYKDEKSDLPAELTTTDSKVVTLQPFQVLIIELDPVNP